MASQNTSNYVLHDMSATNSRTKDPQFSGHQTRAGSTQPVEGARGAGFCKMDLTERAALRKFLRNRELIQKANESVAEARREAKDVVGMAKESLMEILAEAPCQALLVPTLSDKDQKVFLKLKTSKTTSHLEEHLLEAVQLLTAEEVLHVCQEIREAKEAASKPPKRIRRTASTTSTTSASSFASDAIRSSFDPTKPTANELPVETPAQKRKRKAMEAEDHLVACMAQALRKKLSVLSTRENVTVQVCSEQPRKYVHDAARVTEDFLELADKFVQGTRTLQDLKLRKAERVKPLEEEQKKHQETLLTYAKKIPDLLSQAPLKLEVLKPKDPTQSGEPLPEYVILKYEGPKEKPASLTVKGFEQVARTVLETMFGSRGLSEVPVEKPKNLELLLNDAKFRENLARGLVAETESWKRKNAKSSDKVSVALERIPQTMP